MSEKTTANEDVLNERGKTHGEYSEHARCTQAILNVIRTERNWDDLSDEQKEAVHMIAHKLARIAVGNPDINDHWDDIAGYATLVSQRLPGPASSLRHHRESRHQRDRDRLANTRLSRGQDNPRGFDPELDVCAGGLDQ